MIIGMFFNNIELIINAIGFFLIGFGWDYTFGLINGKSYKKGYRTATWLVHALSTSFSLFNYVLFVITNQLWLMPGGAFIWVLGTLIMGYLQSKRSKGAIKWYGFGDGRGNPEENIIFGLWYVFGRPLKIDYSMTSFISRILLIILSLFIYMLIY